MHVEQKRSLLHFLGLPPIQLLHHRAGVVAVAADRFRHDCVRIRALCDEI